MNVSTTGGDEGTRTGGPVFLLVDENKLLRASLARLMARRWPGAAIGEAADGCEALTRARELRPSVVLMDIRMPCCNGIQTTREMKSELPETTVIILTESEDEDDLFEALSSGAHGYLLKDMEPEELFEHVAEALDGQAVIAPAMAQRVLQALVDHVQTLRRGQIGVLTPRELEVLGAVSRGASNQEIAEEFVISVGTVKNHVHSILDKLHLRSRSEVAAYSAFRRMMAGGVQEPVLRADSPNG